MRDWLKDWQEFKEIKNGFINRFINPRRKELAKLSLMVEFLTAEYIKALGLNVVLVSKYTEKHMDVDFYIPSKDLLVSVKADWQAYKTGNVAIEIGNQKQGWIQYTKADVIIFSVVRGYERVGKNFLVIDFTPLYIETDAIRQQLKNLPVRFINQNTVKLNRVDGFRGYKAPHRIALLPVQALKPLYSLVI